jgi:hypothetical protein
VQRNELICGFQLYDHFVFDEKIKAITDIQDDAAVVDGQCDLASDVHIAPDQLKFQTGLVCTFEQSRTECTMHLQSGIHDFPNRKLFLHASSAGRTAARPYPLTLITACC